MVAALIRMLMFVANRAGRDQFAAQIRLNGFSRIALYADDNFHAALVEDIHGSAAHAAGNDHLSSVVCQEVRQKSRTRCV